MSEIGKSKLERWSASLKSSVPHNFKLKPRSPTLTLSILSIRLEAKAWIDHFELKLHSQSSSLAANVLNQLFEV